MSDLPVVDVRSAVDATYQYLQSMRNFIDHKLQNLRLEEVELSEDKNFWLITLGYDRPVEVKTAIGILTDAKNQRDYKLFKVNSRTGKVESMKIRTV